MWTTTPPEEDGIYWFSMTGNPEFALPVSFNRTHDGVMRFSYRADREGLFYAANYFQNAIWWSVPLQRPAPGSPKLSD